MKTYFDLSNKEKDKYMYEFKKTPGGKNLFEVRVILIILTVIIYIGVSALSIYGEETNSVINNLSKIEDFAGFMILLTIVYSTYFKINFTSWLKNKYEIKRW